MGFLPLVASRPSTYHRHIPCMHQRRKRSVPRKSKPQIDLSIARIGKSRPVSCMQFPCLRVTRSLPSLVIIIYKLSSLHGHHGSVVSSNRVTCQAKLSTTFLFYTIERGWMHGHGLSLKERSHARWRLKRVFDAHPLGGYEETPWLLDHQLFY